LANYGASNLLLLLVQLRLERLLLLLLLLDLRVRMTALVAPPLRGKMTSQLWHMRRSNAWLRTFSAKRAAPA
jgi:hypothetical protein